MDACWAIYQNDSAERPRAVLLGSLHNDYLARDATRLIDSAGEEHWVHLARKLLKSSPENPYARSKFIEKEWDQHRDEIPAWEKQGASTPVLLAALGKHYLDTADLDKGRNYLEKYIRLSPEYWAFKKLADSYEQVGDHARWLAALDRYLDEGQDHGLESARVRVNIANYYMSMHQWKKAQPYAEAAAATWAGWAMMCAVRCYEGLQEWDKAETWVQRISERYPNTSLYEWLFFCKRTGHGNAEAARDMVERYLAFTADRPDLVSEEVTGLFYWLSGSPRKAMDHLRKSYEDQTSISAACSLVLIADDLDDAGRRDPLIDELWTKHRARAPRTIETMKLLGDSLKTGDRAALNLATVDKIIESTPPEGRGNIEFLVGWFLKKHGKPEDARAYLLRATQSSGTYGWYAILAQDALRRMGGEPERKPESVDPRAVS